MSQYPQYPQQYPPPSYPQANPYAPVDDPRAPAKRAGILMIVLGALTLLCGACLGIASWGLSLPEAASRMTPEQARKMQMIEEQLHISPSALLAGMAIVALVMSVVYIVMGVITRNGGFVSVVSSIVLVSITIAIAAFLGLSSVLQAELVSACVCGIGVALFVLLLVWLIQAARAAGKITSMQQQYQQQYAQYQQMQQQYGNAGYGQQQYGYGYPPPPAPGTQAQPPQQPQPPAWQQPPQWDQSQPPPPRQDDSQDPPTGVS
jgi:hypothetical protein